MDARAKTFIGFLGVLFLVAGQLIYFTLPDGAFLLFAGHTIVGAACLMIFLFGGGVALLRQRSENRASPKLRSSMVRLILLVAVAVVINLILYRNEVFEYDSTAKKVYSLAPETVELLQNLPGPLRIRAFFLGGVVTDPKARKLLSELSHRGAEVTMFDPEKDLLSLERYGITQSETLHFSLELPSGETRTVKLSHTLGEDDVAGALKKLRRTGSRLVLVSKGHGEASIDDKAEGGYLFLREALEGENLEVRGVAIGAAPELPAETSALIISAPKEEFSEAERRVVADYLSKGGNLLLFHEARTSREVPMLARLFGIQTGEDLVVEPLPAEQGLGVQPKLTDFSRLNPITRSFTRSAIFTTASSVRKLKEADPRAVQELAFSAPSAWAEMNLTEVFSSTPQAAKQADDLPGPVSLAAAAEGSTGGPKLKGRAVVFGDADFVSNVHLRELANRDLVLNAVTWAMGEEPPAGGRARTLQLTTRKLSSEELGRIFLVGAILVPEFFALIGLFIAYRRSR